jgi:hypothetical protein
MSPIFFTLSARLQRIVAKMCVSPSPLCLSVRLSADMDGLMMCYGITSMFPGLTAGKQRVKDRRFQIKI